MTEQEILTKQVNEHGVTTLVKVLSSRYTPRAFSELIGIDLTSPQRERYNPDQHARPILFGLALIQTGSDEWRDAIFWMLLLDYGEVLYDALTRLEFKQGIGWHVGKP
jgi:hypothetical protein